MLDKLLDIKGILSMLGFVLLIVVLFAFFNELQESPLGKNEYANKTLEEGKKSLSILSNGYFIASSIAGTVGLITFVVLMYKKYSVLRIF